MAVRVRTPLLAIREAVCGVASAGFSLVLSALLSAACASPPSAARDAGSPALDAQALDFGPADVRATGDDAARDASVVVDPDGGLDTDADAGDEADSGVYTGPERLSETGLYVDTGRRALADGVTAYSVRWPLWADGAEKERFLWLPPGTRIDAADLDRWRFPVGTKSWKTFTLAGVAIETRLLEKTADGWRMAAYLWDEDGADAHAMPAGVVSARGTAHDVPSSEDCAKCHRGAADGLIGVSTLQLGEAGIAVLGVPGWLHPISPDRAQVPGSGEVQATLGYLHGNCAHCHNDIHPLSRFERLRLTLPVGVATPQDTPVYRTAIGLLTRHDVAGTQIVIVAGEPAQSQLLARMRTHDADARMPPLGAKQPDDTAVALIEAWISGLR